MTKAVVLYVEDEEMDRFLMERAFQKRGLGEALRMVDDGQAVLDYLNGAGKYSDRQRYPMPNLVLLDLNLPELHGFEVLKWIRTQPAGSELRVVVFSSSEREEDQARAKDLGANEFVKKPGSGLTFGDIAHKLHTEWLSSAGVATEASSTSSLKPT